MHVINSADRISEFQLAMYCKLIQIMPEVLCSINSVLVGFGGVMNDEGSDEVGSCSV